MRRTQRHCQFINRHDRWVTPTALKTGNILLAEARTLSELLLRPALALAQAFKVRPDQVTHIHAALIGLAIPLSLSTIICIDETGDV